MLILTDAAAKFKKKGGGIRQIGRFNFYGNKISFNSAAGLSTLLTFANINLKIKHFYGRIKT
jgi:hypothetical protein